MISAITEYLEELKESFAPTIAKAEDEQEGGEEESSDEKGDGEEGDGEEGDGEEGSDNEDSDNEEEDDEEEEDEEEDDEEEEEGGDPLDALKAECANTTEGKELTHHFMECVERVHKAEEQPGYEDAEYKEDCVEEFFHLTHYIDNCAAPRLFGKLK